MSSWRDIREKRAETPQQRERIERQTSLLALEVALAEVRKRRGVTQTDLSEALATTQANVSRIEREDDLLLSTLARYVAGLGGTLEIHAVFDDEDIPLTTVHDLVHA